MIQEYNSSNLPIENNQKLQDTEGIIKSITDEEYHKIVSKAKTLKSLKEFISKTQSHSQFGIVKFVDGLLRLYINSTSNIKNTKSKQSQLFGDLSIDQEQIINTLEEILNFNPQILIKHIRVASLETNLFLLILTTLYNIYIQNNQDATKILQWIGIIYDGSFLKVCLDGKIKKTLSIIQKSISQQVNSQKQQLQVLSLLQQITGGVEYYSEDCERKEIETLYVGF